VGGRARATHPALHGVRSRSAIRGGGRLKQESGRGNGAAAEAPPPGGEGPQPIGSATRVVYALGDHTVNLALSALSLVFLFFLTEIAGLRPALAGAVIWIARVFDAVTDPLMGRVSDQTHTRFGRRRPYFLLGALPFGVFFALLWTTPVSSQAAMFAWYCAVYVGLSLAMTVLSVPYMALIPEMATDYDGRTAFNTFRGAAAVLGTLVAAGLQPAALALGGDARSYALVGAALAVWMVVPWPAVFAVSFERPELRGDPPLGLRKGLRSILAHASYRRLCALYIAARIAVDLAGLGLIYFFSYWLRRAEDFGPALYALMGVVVLSFPFWLRISRRADKHRLFALGATWWVVMLVGIALVQPDWPRWSIFVIAGAAGVGYAVADLMPWAMLGEVIDEDQLLTGQRREGIYNGFFTFLRKLGGASAILLAGISLDLSGYVQDGPQPESALLAIRAITSLAPAAFLAVAIGLALGYPLGRARHTEILAALRAGRPRER
jgi:GPH family glycoside/pentoside/hexuronide:cation symporter